MCRIRAHPDDSLLFAVLSYGMPFVVLIRYSPPGAARRPAHAGVPDGRHGPGALISALSLAARKTVLGLVTMIPSPPRSSAWPDRLRLSHVFWLSMVMVLVAAWA